MLVWSKEEFRELYDDYVDMIYRICFLYLKNESDAKDGVQDIFMKIWEKQPVFDNENHKKAWLIQTTKNHCIDILKSSWWSKRTELEDWQEPMTEVEPTENPLLEYVMKMPQKYREVIYLYYYEEYSVREMSGILKRNESTIQSQLSAGREKLKRILELEGRDFLYG